MIKFIVKLFNNLGKSVLFANKNTHIMENDLKHKEKTIADLVRFLKLRPDDASKYSLLIGSGCSITSGVRSGESLIKEWKKKVLEESGKYREGMDIDSFLKKEENDWYDDKNAYSTLFEKRFDLQSQRRAFVESEVSKAIPSIGYAYLVKLIEGKFFNTIFTTNFDDLLNEAFYRFSNVDKRPLVCAHDSAISSVTVTSKRPKIIKLHGDYLFEDIKSTSRETESLQANMKNKFIEFAKDYGLIVVGYAGNDRSIMDILVSLLKKEDYFRSGIYWCIKDDAAISDELKRLLWKDRVYFVKIDGFDELMAELNKELNEGALPIDNAMLSSENQQKLIKSLTSNEVVRQYKSKIIQEDCQKLQKQLKKNMFENFLRQTDFGTEKNENRKGSDRAKRKNGYPDLSDAEKEGITDVRISFVEDDIVAVKNKIELSLQKNIMDSRYKIYLLQMKLDLIKSSKYNYDDYKNTLDELIRIDPYSEKYYINAINTFNKIDIKLSYIDKIMSIYPNDYFLYLRKALIYSDIYKSVADKSEIQIDKVVSYFNKSIELNGSISNDAWVKLCDFYGMIYKNDKDKLISGIKELLPIYEKQDKYHPNYLKVCSSNYKILHFDIENQLKDGYDFAKKSDSSSRVESVLILLLKYLKGESKKTDLDSYMEDYEKCFIPSSDYLIEKATILAELNNKIHEAIEILEKIDNGMVYGYLIRLYSITKQKDKAKELVDKFGDLDFDLIVSYYLDFGMYDELVKTLDKYWAESNPVDFVSFISYSYAKIQLNDSSIFKQIKKYYDNPITCLPEIMINYFIADEMYNKRIDKNKIKSKIIDKGTYIDSVLGAAYSLIGDENNAFIHIQNAIYKDALLKYSVRDWPAFKKYRENPKFKKIVGLDV